MSLVRHIHLLKLNILIALRPHPIISAKLHSYIKYFPFLLPHDKYYYGFKHFIETKRGLFVDIGANDGISALGFRRINKTYHILSLEPNPIHEAVLRQLKKKIPRFDYMMVGAGNHRGKKTLFTPVTNNTSVYTSSSLDLSFVTNFTPGERYIKQFVNIIRLDSLRLSPSIVKLDTEGYDLEALKGFTKTIQRYRPYVLFEFNPLLVSREIRFFSQLHYHLYDYDYKHDYFLPFVKKRNMEILNRTRVFPNIFAIPNEKR